MSSSEQKKKQPVSDGESLGRFLSNSLYIVAIGVILAFLYQSFISNA